MFVFLSVQRKRFHNKQHLYHSGCGCGSGFSPGSMHHPVSLEDERKKRYNTVAINYVIIMKTIIMLAFNNSYS